MSEKLNETDPTEANDEPSVVENGAQVAENDTATSGSEPPKATKSKPRKRMELPTEDKWAGF